MKMLNYLVAGEAPPFLEINDRIGYILWPNKHTKFKYVL